MIGGPTGSSPQTTGSTLPWPPGTPPNTRLRIANFHASVPRVALYGAAVTIAVVALADSDATNFGRLWAGWAIGVVAGSFLHELGHACAARNLGYQTTFSAMTVRMQMVDWSRPTGDVDPQHLYWIAGAGPAMNVAIALITALAAATGTALALPLLGAAVANALHALNNLIPRTIRGAPTSLDESGIPTDGRVMLIARRHLRALEPSLS